MDIPSLKALSLSLDETRRPFQNRKKPNTIDVEQFAFEMKWSPTAPSPLKKDRSASSILTSNE
jgi:hypothetical protein